MKEVIFEAPIDGVIWKFRVYSGPLLYRAEGKHGKYIRTAYGETEEKAILQLVKMIEK